MSYLGTSGLEDQNAENCSIWFPGQKPQHIMNTFNFEIYLTTWNLVHLCVMAF